MAERLTRARVEGFDYAGLMHRAPSKHHYSDVISDSTDVLCEDGSPLLSFRVLEEFPRDLLGTLGQIKYSKAPRTRGLIVRSKTFGALPRIPLRRDYCTLTAFTVERPDLAEVLYKYGRIADGIYQKASPPSYARSVEQIEEIRPEWRIPGTVYTSGICNKDNPLRYHRDAGNFKGTWSAMYALSRDCGGGLLVIPEYRLAVSFSRPALVMFDGASLLHGVSPIRKRSKGSVRYSVVYYGMSQLRHCGSRDEELARIRKVKLQREVRRLGGHDDA